MQHLLSSTLLFKTLSQLLCHSVLFSVKAAPAMAFKLPSNVIVPAIFGFGDSLIDPGNNNYVNTLAKCNFPPYGQDFMGGIPTGRFSNGKIPTDLIAEELSIKQYVPAYLDPDVQPKDLLTGVSFASGAAGFDPLTSNLMSAISLNGQIENFKEYVKRVKILIGEEKTNFLVSNSLFLIVAGSDDIANTYFDTPLRRTHYDVDSYTTLMLNYASSFIQDLYKGGARRMIVFSVPPIGCVPSQRTIGGGVLRDCAQEYNDAAQIYNSKLRAEVNLLTLNFTNSRIVYGDIYNIAIDLIRNSDKYGFKEIAKGCCGTGLVEVGVFCNPLGSVCPNVTEYLFWDSYHPTERGYQLLLQMLSSAFSSVFYP